MMKKIFFATFLILCSIATFAQNGVPVDGIVAVIGKEIIMQSDLEKHYLDYTAQFNGYGEYSVGS